MIYIISNAYLLLMIYYFTIHKSKINKKEQIRKKVLFGEKCFSCHEEIIYKYDIPPFEINICKSCERHSKIVSLRKSLLFNKIKRRSFLLKNKRKIIITIISISIFIVLINKPYFNNLLAVQWIYFIIIDYLMIKPVKI
jgi:hypothetical protein